jgi:hypothetical protein
VNRRFRFKISGRWSPWYTDGDDISFLHDNKEVQSMETVEEMPREQAVEFLKYKFEK